MATVTKNWNFTTGALGFAFTAVGVEVGAQDATHGLTTTLSGKNLTATESATANGWILSDTFANIFGIPSGSTVTQVGLNGSDQVGWLCFTFTTGGASNSAAGCNVTPGAAAATQIAAKATFSATSAGLFNSVTAADTALTNLGSDTLKIVLSASLTTGASNSAVVAVGYTSLKLQITYTPPATTAAPLPKVIGQAVQRAATRCWARRPSGIVVPRLWTPEDGLAVI